MIDFNDLLDGIDFLLVAPPPIARAPGAEFRRRDDLKHRTRLTRAANEQIGNPSRRALLIEGRGGAANLENARVVIEASTQRQSESRL